MNSRDYFNDHTVLLSKNWLGVTSAKWGVIPPRANRSWFNFRVLNFFSNTGTLDFFNRLFAPSFFLQVKRARYGGLR